MAALLLACAVGCAVAPEKAAPIHPGPAPSAPAKPSPAVRPAEPAGPSQPAARAKAQPAPPPHRDSDRITALARNALSALREGDPARAAALYERAILAQPRREEFHYYLALAREELGEQTKAIRGYARLREIAGSRRWALLAEARELALKRRLGLQLIRKSKYLADLNRYEDAVGALQRALRLGLPPGLDYLARTHYYDYAARHFAARLQEEQAPVSVVPVAIAEFTSGMDARDWESPLFTRRITAELSAHGNIVARARMLSQAAARRLAHAAGDVTDPELLREVARTEEADWLVVGAIRENIELRLFEVATGRLLLSAAVERLGPVPDQPEPAIWRQLPHHPGVNQELQVEVWTPGHEYLIGQSIPVMVRASRDSYVIVVTLDTAGELRLLFPTDAAADNFVRAGKDRQLSLPDPGLTAVWPPGVMGLKAIAVTRRLDLPTSPAESEPPSQESFAWQLRARLHQAPAHAWATGEWALQIRLGPEPLSVTEEHEHPD